MAVLSLSLCHIVVVVIIFICVHLSHRRGRESNPDLSDEITEYKPLHCASTVPHQGQIRTGLSQNPKTAVFRSIIQSGRSLTTVECFLLTL